MLIRYCTITAGIVQYIPSSSTLDLNFNFELTPTNDEKIPLSLLSL